MVLWIKRNPSSWVEVKKVWVKRNPTSWVSAKKIWVKNAVSGWSQFWPEAGPYPEEELSLFTSLTTYPSFLQTFPRLTATVYHFYFDGTLTLKYKWSVGPTSSGPWTDLDGYSTYQTYSPGNPSEGSSNTISITPELSEYIHGRNYFKFAMQATDSSGTSTHDAISEPINLEGPYWYQSATFFGTASPGYTFTWDAGVGRFQDSSYNIGYMTTIYRSNDNGVTKEYLVGTSTTPEYSYVDNTQYAYTPIEEDIGYTYYASTYAIHGDSDGPFEDALSSTTISGTKKVLGPPGPFSITSFIKGPISGNLVNGSRTLTLSYTASTDATQYQYKIERSIDNVTWYSFADYFYQVAATDPTTNITITDSSTQSYRYYRATMRATNETNLYTTSTNTNVPATGSPPGAPTINSATVYFGTVTLNYTETTNFGSGSGIYAHDYAYKLSTDTNYSQWIYTGSYGGSLPISGLEAGRTYSFKIRSYNDDNVVGPESNSITVTIPAEPGALTNTVAKTWSSGSVTVAFTTGNNTTGVYYFATNGPYVGSSQFIEQIDGLFSNLSPNTSYVREINNFPTTDDQYDIILYAQNETVFGDNVGTVSEVATGIYPNGSDKALASLPTFSNRTGSSFTANYALFNTTSVNIDVRLNGSSIAGYPQTLSQSAGPNGASFSHTPYNTLSDGTLYTFSVTPYYQSPIAPLMLDYGVQKSATVSTIYKFSFGKTLYVSSNGHIGLDSGSSSFTQMSSGKNIAILVTDLQQWYLAEYSDTNFYHLYFRSYLYGQTNSAVNAVDYQIKFYNDSSINYCDVYMVRVGTNVTLPSIQRGYYGLGNTEYGGTDGASFFIGTGSTFRVYFDGTPMKTTGVPWTAINDNIWDVIQTWPYPNTVDDTFTAVATAPNQQAAVLTAPIITSVSVSNTGGPVSANFVGGSGPFYQAFWWSVASAPTGQVSPDASGSSSPLTDSTGPSTGDTNYMYVRSVQTAGELSLGPSTLASSWSSGYAFNMTTPPVIPTITMGSNTNITSSSGTINWSSTNQASFSSTGTFSATGTNQTSISKTGLSASTNYTGTVTVTSSTGHTASANYSLTTTAASTVPGAPTNVFASGISSSGATINWSAPSSNGGSAITRYEVNRDGFGFFNVGNVNQYFYTLSQGTYNIGVRAVNVNGSGPATNISVTIPAAFVPPTSPAPSWTSGSNFQRTSTILRWFTDYPSISGSGSITGMQFQIRTTAGGGTLLASGTRAYPGAGSYPYAGGGTIWAFRCGTSDGDISYSASARYARARVVMQGTDGSTYYGTWTGWI